MFVKVSKHVHTKIYFTQSKLEYSDGLLNIKFNFFSYQKFEPVLNLENILNSYFN